MRNWAPISEKIECHLFCPAFFLVRRPTYWIRGLFLQQKPKWRQRSAFRLISVARTNGPIMVAALVLVKSVMCSAKLTSHNVGKDLPHLPCFQLEPQLTELFILSNQLSNHSRFICLNNDSHIITCIFIENNDFLVLKWYANNCYVGLHVQYKTVGSLLCQLSEALQDGEIRFSGHNLEINTYPCRNHRAEIRIHNV